MKALSLLEPWASLVMLKEKKIETRSWKTNYRGELLIHASAGHRPWHINLAWQEPFYSALLPVRTPGKVQGSKGSIRVHFGCIIAKCKLVDCVEIPHSVDGVILLPSNGEFGGQHLRAIIPVTSSEYFFGDYTPGRYAWILDEVEPLEKPIPAKGHLGLWDFPDELLP